MLHLTAGAFGVFVEYDIGRSIAEQAHEQAGSAAGPQGKGAPLAVCLVAVIGAD